ncbi:unnamed protein product, partial [Urochloa humidicola]
GVEVRRNRAVVVVKQRTCSPGRPPPSNSRLSSSSTSRLQTGMAWLQSLLSPLKKLWVRMHSAQHKKRGIYILYEDVKSCPCEDVQILWSILVESHPHPPPLRLKH